MINRRVLLSGLALLPTLTAMDADSRRPANDTGWHSILWAKAESTRRTSAASSTFR